MTLRFSTVLVILLLVFPVFTYCQGRVDSDSILNGIWWKTYQIDNNTSLKVDYKADTTKGKNKNFIVRYSKNDSLYKVIRLIKVGTGTQMTTFYYSNNEPIFIAQMKNNYLLSDGQQHLIKAMSSFESLPDTNAVVKKPLYNISYRAKYFFYKDRVRYASVMTGDVIRVDNKSDVEEGLHLLQVAKTYPNIKNNGR